MTALDLGTSLQTDEHGWAQLWCANRTCVDDFAQDNHRPAVLCDPNDDEALSRNVEHLRELARSAGWFCLGNTPPMWLCASCTERGYGDVLTPRATATA